MSAADRASIRRALFVALPLAGVVALGAYAYYQNHGPAAVQGSAPKGAAGAQGAGGPPPGAPVAVEVAAVKTARLQEDAAAIGTLRSNESVVVRPEISGRISRINFIEGRPVEKGQLLVALDASVHAAEVQQAKANLALADTNFNRVTELEREKFVSPNAKDQALNALRVAQATLALADARLAKTEIRAPFAGVIGIRQVSVGDYVKEGQDLVTLEDISALKVDFRLPELLLTDLKRGQTVEVASDALPGRTYAATLDAIDPLIDQNGRALILRARLRNTEGQLRPGMFVRTRVILAERPRALTVPEEALIPVGADQYVFRVTADKAARVKVKTGLRRDTQVEITEGLQAGDVVVTAGQLKLR
ncbi:MAG TPA: efflux RND transporter periplasmic adaptor subunit, partial [Burkholderiales bacterium]|nr:efflux RND transporter periplasmic adaptor subunit [Burkholderiales bacterium]